VHGFIIERTACPRVIASPVVVLKFVSVRYSVYAVLASSVFELHVKDNDTGLHLSLVKVVLTDGSIE
jgi:hypothetical protein